jgi:hypothetical protein
MRCQSSFAFIPLMILPLVTIAKAHDASRYPNLKGQWTVIITAGLEGQAVKFEMERREFIALIGGAGRVAARGARAATRRCD